MWYTEGRNIVVAGDACDIPARIHSWRNVPMTTLPPHDLEDKPYTVYALIDPRDLAVCYIGITNDVYARFAQHLSCNGNNLAKDAWIAELKQENVMLIMKTLEVVTTVEQARERETFWIHHYRFLGVSLFNQVIPSIRIPKRVTQPVLIRERQRPNAGNAGRKGDYGKVKEIVLHYHKHHAWPDGVSNDMKAWYAWFYFTKPKRDEKPFRQGKGYEFHKRAYDRGRQWVADLETAQEGDRAGDLYCACAYLRAWFWPGCRHSRCFSRIRHDHSGIVQFSIVSCGCRLSKTPEMALLGCSVQALPATS